jgi:uncharacterized OB-fold protein
MVPRPIDAGLFTAGENPRLIAGRCRDCQVVTFPRQAACPRCTGRNIEGHVLPAEGLLWTWTVQRFPPKPPFRSPGDFEPYGVGYVEFPGECIVEGRLTTADPARLRIGARMRMTLIENHRDPDGTAVTTYAFEPTGPPA